LLLIASILIFFAENTSSNLTDDQIRPIDLSDYSITTMFPPPIKVTKLNPGRPFVVGHVHHKWVTIYEVHTTKAFVHAMNKNLQHKTKSYPCHVIDVGMNDGFYTNLAGSYGCKVWSFEVQSPCIDIAVDSIRKNNISELISIFNNPVSNAHNKTITIPYSEKLNCEGAFRTTLAKMDCGKECWYPYFSTTRTFQTISLDRMFLDLNQSIDFLKVDTEGHEPQVLEGAEGLFLNRLIKFATVELVSKYFIDREKPVRNTDIFERILSYNYSMKCSITEPYRHMNSADFYKIDRKKVYFHNDSRLLAHAIDLGGCDDWDIVRLAD